jgi:8-oxo-dGTP pyrophosphatase MutT (NUDIX family)
MEKLSPEILRAHKGISFVGVSINFICYNKDKEFVLGKRGQNARDEQGRWDSGAGGLKWGETAESTIRREVMEELGAECKKIDFICYSDVFRELSDGTPTHWLALRFAVLVDKKEVKNNEPDVHDEIGWFTTSKLPSPLHSQVQVIIDLAKEKNYIK